MSSLAVVTTFPPNRWTAYAKRMIESHIKYWPDDVVLYAYHEGNRPEKAYEFDPAKVKFVNIEEANPELVKFKQRHKDDPVANGETTEIPGGVRRLPGAGDKDKNKGSFLWDAVRFSHKTFCVDHAIKTINTDMILWLDADTYTFTNIPESFIRSTLPENKMTCYLGRGGMYPECGWVGYNKKHAKLNEFINTWTSLYKDNTIFDELEWHDSYLYWQVLQKVAPNEGYDIGVGAGHDGQHIFVNSDLGQYIDHMKGKRKIKGKSSRTDLRKVRTETYWKNIEKQEFINKIDSKTQSEIISKVAKGMQGN